MNNDVSKYSIDDKSRENNTRSICTMGCIQKILEKTYLHNMGVAMTKDISTQNVRIYIYYLIDYKLKIQSCVKSCAIDGASTTAAATTA